MKLTLERPFAVFDLETTGLNITQDRIIEIAIVKLNPDGSEEEYYHRVNPTIPISPESQEICGISEEDVKNEPTFAELADEIAAFIGTADLAGYNSNKFDVPLLAEEFLRCKHPFEISTRRFVDVQNIFHKMEQRTLAAAYQFYCQQPMENAHNALYDTRVTLDVFKAQLDRYPDLSQNVGELAEFSRQGNLEWHDFAGRLGKNAQGKVTYNFGKHRGKTVEEIAIAEPGYYGWMLDADFPLYTKRLLKEEMDRIRAAAKLAAPQQPAAKNLLQSQPAKPTEHKPQRPQTPREPEQSIEDKLAALKNKFSPK